MLNPPLPEEVLVNFHVNCDKLVFCAYVLNCLATTPSNLVSFFKEMFRTEDCMKEVLPGVREAEIL